MGEWFEDKFKIRRESRGGKLPRSGTVRPAEKPNSVSWFDRIKFFLFGKRTDDMLKNKDRERYQ